MTPMKGFLVWLWLILRADALYRARDILVWSSDQIPEQDLHISPQDNKLHVKSRLNVVLGDDTVLKNVKLSAVATLSPDKKTVDHLENSSYKAQSLQFPSNEVTNPKAIYKITEALKPQLDELLSDQLASHLRSRRSISEQHVTPTATPDEIVDDILSVGKKKVSHTESLGDVDKAFKKGYFKAWRGWITGLDTVYRTSHTIMEVNRDTVTIYATFSLATLQFGFKNYKAKYSIWRFKGDVKGSVGQTLANARVTLVPSKGNCSASLDEVKVAQMDGISVRLSGLGLFKKTIMKHVYKEIEEHKSSAIAGAELELSDFISDILANYDCSKFFRNDHFKVLSV